MNHCSYEYISWKKIAGDPSTRTSRYSIFSYFPTNHVTACRPLRKIQYNPIFVSSLSLLYDTKSYCIGICHWFISLILKMWSISFGYYVKFHISFKNFLFGNILNLHIPLVIDLLQNRIFWYAINFFTVFRYHLWFSYVMCISISWIRRLLCETMYFYYFSS